MHQPKPNRCPDGKQRKVQPRPPTPPEPLTQRIAARWAKFRRDAREFSLLLLILKQRRNHGEQAVRRRKMRPFLRIALFASLSFAALLTCAFFAEQRSADGFVRAGMLTSYDSTVESDLHASDRDVVTVFLADGGGEPVPVQTPQFSVGQILALNNLTLREHDTLNVDKTRMVTDGMTITITRVDIRDEAHTEQIPYQTHTSYVQTVPRGETRETQAGAPGQRTTVVRTTTVNGAVSQVETVSDIVDYAATDRYLEVGSGGVLTGADGNQYSYSYYIDVSATAYGSEQDGTALTYSGRLAKIGSIAVDPTVIPLGSRVYVSGNYGDYGVCSADDIGGGIKGFKIDIYMGKDWDKMYAFGVRAMRVYFLD